ncbi:hypothetical protein [Clostridium sp. SM-530-WT-3G]|uniref:hypothetical protein n=1 Tax=Clostridium sp. SM-530-WT-3G TaxID=2725303 RepID=UPI00145EA3A6|nr:hypothetical protein [Clostridium sp. SM-530-WT-3G]NME82915.1 hypothetical protein [Clostridium sp. SM-530-WT-3G]
MWKKLKKSDIITGLICILIVSIVGNIYSIYKIENYKYRIGQESYIKIQDIKQRNESNMEILNKSIDSKNIRNEEILKLYKNYDVMSSDIIELWQQYSEYKDNSITLLSKKIDTNKIIQNDINGKIKEYMYSTLTKEMKNEKSKLILKDDNLMCFEAMDEMSKKIYDYFNEFDAEKLKGCSDKDKEKKIIKNNYWIDMLNGIYCISDDYADIQWNIESAEN